MQCRQRSSPPWTPTASNARHSTPDDRTTVKATWTAWPASQIEIRQTWIAPRLPRQHLGRKHLPSLHAWRSAKASPGQTTSDTTCQHSMADEVNVERRQGRTRKPRRRIESREPIFYLLQSLLVSYWTKLTNPFGPRNPRTGLPCAPAQEITPSFNWTLARAVFNICCIHSPRRADTCIFRISLIVLNKA